MTIIPEDIISYWINSAEHDKETMQALYNAGRYSDTLFFGHIMLEKILKATVVETTKEQAPYMHDLVRLSELSGVTFTEAELDLLDIVNTFNIRARYPDYKLTFYKIATKEYADKSLEPINQIYKKICLQLKQKI